MSITQRTLFFHDLTEETLHFTLLPVATLLHCLSTMIIQPDLGSMCVSQRCFQLIVRVHLPRDVGVAGVTSRDDDVTSTASRRAAAEPLPLLLLLLLLLVFGRLQHSVQYTRGCNASCCWTDQWQHSTADSDRQTSHTARCVTFAVARIRVKGLPLKIGEILHIFPSGTQSMGDRGSKKAYTGPKTDICLPTKFGCDRSIVVGCRSRNDQQTSRQTDRQTEWNDNKAHSLRT